jgi:hypothetical protein
MMLLVTFHLELRFASGSTKLELLKDSAVRSGETSVFLYWVHEGASRHANWLRGNNAIFA